MCLFWRFLASGVGGIDSLDLFHPQCTCPEVGGPKSDPFMTYSGGRGPDTCMFPRFFGGRRPETCIFLGLLRVREAAGGRELGRNMLDRRFAGRWGGTIGGDIQNCEVEKRTLTAWSPPEGAGGLHYPGKQGLKLHQRIALSVRAPGTCAHSFSVFPRSLRSLPQFSKNQPGTGPSAGNGPNTGAY